MYVNNAGVQVFRCSGVQEKPKSTVGNEVQPKAESGALKPEYLKTRIPEHLNMENALKMRRCAALAALLAGCCMQSIPAHAQGYAGFTADARDEAVKKPGSKFYGSFSFYPLAAFETGGRLPNLSAGTTTSYGTLFAADLGVKPARARGAIEIGTWYWNSGVSDLYQVHLRGFFTPELGVRAAYLASTSVSGSAYTTFLVYDLTSRRIQPRARRRWTVETGLGVFFDPTAGRTTSSFSMYVQGSVEIAKRITINGSQWYLRDRSADLNRFALGLGYSF